MADHAGRLELPRAALVLGEGDTSDEEESPLSRSALLRQSSVKSTADAVRSVLACLIQRDYYDYYV